MFRGKDVFSKTKAFKEHKFCDLAVKRVLYRLKLYFITCTYHCFVLVHFLSMILNSNALISSIS
jgi:hypothetical protein